MGYFPLFNNCQLLLLLLTGWSPISLVTVSDSLLFFFIYVTLSFSSSMCLSLFLHVDFFFLIHSFRNWRFSFIQQLSTSPLPFNRMKPYFTSETLSSSSSMRLSPLLLHLCDSLLFFIYVSLFYFIYVSFSSSSSMFFFICVFECWAFSFVSSLFGWFISLPKVLTVSLKSISLILLQRSLGER